MASMDPETASTLLSGFPGIAGSPQPNGWRDLMTGRHIIEAMEGIERASLYPDGRAQTNAEHSYRLGHMCLQYVGSQRPDLDPSIVMAMCYVHDLKEVYAGDTPIRNEELLRSKEEREEAGLAMLLTHDITENSFMGKVIQRYEAGKDPESKFVHAMDKFEPIEFAIQTEGATYRIHGDKFSKVVKSQLPKTFNDKHVFHLMTDALLETGRLWQEWDCKPFEGTPGQIVGGVIDQLRQPKLEHAKK